MAGITQTVNSPLNQQGLVVNALSHKFGPDEILSNVSFTLKPGEVVAIVGPSGGGKTTLLHLCAGLLDVEEGEVISDFAQHAFAFQEPRLLPWQTCVDNIAYGLKARGVAKAKRHQLASEIALRFGLERGDLLKFPKELSGGMRQRVSFARAMVTQPDLLFLDEPFSALDIGLKRELIGLLTQDILERQMSVLFITHDLMEAVRLSHRIHLLQADPGRIAHTFTIDTPLTQRTDSFVYNETAQLLNHPAIINTFEISASV